MHFVTSDHTAGDLFPRPARGLCGKIIPVMVDHHRPPKDIPDPEPVCTDQKIRSPAAPQQRRQVPRMLRMLRTRGIEVRPRICKVDAGAASSRVDMQGKEARFVLNRKPGHHNLHQHAGRLLVKPGLPCQLRIFRSALDVRHCIRPKMICSQNITLYSLCGQLMDVH